MNFSGYGKIKKKIKQFRLKFFIFVNYCIYGVSPSFARNFHYRRVRKEKLDRTNPKGFNQKLQVLMESSDWLEWGRRADKFLVRDVVADSIGNDYLVDLYGVYDDPSDIIWEDLPDKFVIKYTHGCGFNIVVKDKKKENFSSIVSQLESYKKSNIAFVGLELHYFPIKPRIIVEQYLPPRCGDDDLIDYKFYCFDGVPRVVLVCSNRSESLRLNFFNLEWEEMYIGKSELRNHSNIPAPKCLSEMIRLSKKLSSEFKFVRIDFYEVNGHPYFGEMTFTPAGGVANYYTKEGELVLGEMLTV